MSWLWWLPFILSIGIVEHLSTLVLGYKILQLSDFHYDIDYSATGDPADHCHGSTAKDTGFYGNYECDSSARLVKLAIDNAKRVIPNPDVIVWTGDNVPHVENYSDDYVMNAFNFTSQKIARAFPNTPVIPVLGNHDYNPANQFPASGSDLYKRIYNLWSSLGWLNPQNIDTFFKAGFYSTVVRNTSFLCLNTNLYFVFDNVSFDHEEDPGEQFAFAEEFLRRAESRKEMVHVVAHIPPGVFEKTPNFAWMRPKYNRRLLDIFARYASTIGLMLFGHHHSDTFKLVLNSTGHPVQTLFMAPAVTPWRSSLSGAGANNPAFRIIDFDASTNRIAGIVTYYIDLDDLNAGRTTEWIEEYSFKTAYGLVDFSPASILDLVRRLKSDPTTFKKYIEFNSVKKSNETVPSGVFREAQLCAIEFADLDDYQRCMTKARFERFLMLGI